MRLVFPLAIFLTASCSKKDPPPPSPTPPSATTSAASPQTSATTSTAAAAKDAALEGRPLEYTTKITSADLDSRTLRELSLIRNYPFARLGKKFRKDWLNEYFSAQSWYAPKDKVDETKVSQIEKDNSNFVADYEAKLTKAELHRRADALKAKGDSVTKEEKLELHLLSIRLGHQEIPSEKVTSPLEDPKALDRVITTAELDNLSLRDLRILRNTIYARRGRPFKSPILSAYFSSTDWYKPDDDYTDARLSAIDNKNIKIVRSVEDSLGGPMNDAQEAAWMGGA
jgi:hypothetical protein